MLDELRKKPKAVRAQYAFFSALGITGVISLVWLVSLSVSLDMSPEIKESKSETSGAFSQFYDGLKGNLANSISALNITEQPKESADTATTSATTTSSSTPPAENVFNWVLNDEGSTVDVPATPPRTILIGTSSTKTTASTSTEL